MAQQYKARTFYGTLSELVKYLEDYEQLGWHMRQLWKNEGAFEMLLCKNDDNEEDVTVEVGYGSGV